MMTTDLVADALQKGGGSPRKNDLAAAAAGSNNTMSEAITEEPTFNSSLPGFPQEISIPGTLHINDTQLTLKSEWGETLIQTGRTDYDNFLARVDEMFLEQDSMVAESMRRSIEDLRQRDEVIFSAEEFESGVLPSQKLTGSPVTESETSGDQVPADSTEAETAPVPVLPVTETETESETSGDQVPADDVHES